MKNAFTDREMRLLRNEAEEQQERMKGGRLWRNADFLLYIGIVVMVALGIRVFIAEPIAVDGASMTPTLLHSEKMLVEKITYWFSEPARGDIIICYYPGYTESCVKRVIGLPGDRLRITDGKTYINDRALDEGAYWYGDILVDSAEVTVGADEVFVMGDNRNDSKDSRNQSVGCIPYAKIVGKVRAVIWPIPEGRIFAKVTYPWS